MNSITAGELLDIISRAKSVIELSEQSDEHAELINELDAAETLIREEIGASHIGTGADEVLIQRGDN